MKHPDFDQRTRLTRYRKDVPFHVKKSEMETKTLQQKSGKKSLKESEREGEQQIREFFESRIRLYN